MSPRRKLFVFVAVPLVVIFLGVAGVFMLKRQSVNRDGTVPNPDTTSSASTAVKAGRDLSGRSCQGEGVPYKLSVSPMKAGDFAMIIPYGLTVGGHVTPIDHQYFTPKDQHSARDSYDVVAMADAKLVNIGSRTNDGGTEYRLVFSISCTYFYYYDLLTSLTPDLLNQFTKAAKGSQYANTDIDVKAGELIGRIGGQTLDFAVWDTTKPLTGFVVPEHYQAESWKIYTADPLDYYTDELKAFALSRYPRTTAPISGKIDYDIDGKLIGNWFAEGSNGYEGTAANRQAGYYWKTHLSFAPDLYDPTHFIISIGDFGGEASQFLAKGNAPLPENVTMETGLVKYDLVQKNYVTASGESWNQNFLTVDPKIKEGSSIVGCVLVQMTEARKLRFESFPQKSCSSVSGFSADAVVSYER